MSFIVIFTTTTALPLWKKPCARNGKRKLPSITICWTINWAAHMNPQPAVLQKFTLWHAGEHFPQNSTPFCSAASPYALLPPKPTSVSYQYLLMHILLMSSNRKKKVREVHFHQHGRVSLGAILSFLWRSLAWKGGEQSLKRCHQKMATATALEVSITTLIWCLALL